MVTFIGLSLRDDVICRSSSKVSNRRGIIRFSTMDECYEVTFIFFHNFEPTNLHATLREFIGCLSSSLCETDGAIISSESLPVAV